MAFKALKGLTIKIGGDTSDLTKALDGVQNKSQKLSTELGQINKLLKLDPKNTELLAQKQKVLAEAISNTESKLDTLREAEKQVQEQFERGEVSEEQVRALQREIIATENKLQTYKNAAKETADAVEALGKESDGAAGKLGEQADKSKKAEQAAEDLDFSATDLAKGGLALLAAAAAAVVTSIVAMAEASREYRMEMGKLDAAFTDAGHSAEVATKTYEELQGVVGETDQAVEAANHLAALCDTEEELAEWTEILTGVYGKWGASLNIESLAEAANETARVGTVTGSFADALNWASAEGETFGVTLKENTKANEEWNKKVEEAASAEDYFNLALEQCSDEQERQQLITKTLTKLYSGAADQYKKTNAEVIRANKANEKWNKTMAKVGKTVEPVVTDIEELGIAVLEDAADPLEDVANFIRKKVLPAIKDTGNWVKQNLPLLKSLLIGAAAAMVALEAATIATTVAHKGLKGAIASTTVAQKALSLAQAASPIGILLTATVGLTAALAALTLASMEAKGPAEQLTAEEKALMEAADEAAEAFREQKKATDEALRETTAQMGHVSDLAGELRGLADASGKVKEKDQERANFILNELNEALGTEYTMVDGVIVKYDELKTSIDEVIQSKLANSLLEASNANYIAAIQNESQALENLNLKEQEYQSQLDVTKQKEQEYLQARENWEQAVETGNQAAIESASWYMLQAGGIYENEKQLLNEKKAAYDQAAADYGGYYNTIANYEEAQTAALSGNYEKAVEILSEKGGAFGTYSEKVDEETAKVLDTLYKEAIDAGLEAERTKANFENGVDGYTEEMVAEAEKGYKDTMEQFANAYADAEGVGTDLTDGMTAGAESGRNGLLAKARSLVAGFLEAARNAADSHSPSRKAIAIFEDIGEGAEIGVENKTDDVARAGTKQATALLNAYRDQEVNAQRSLRNIAEQETARHATRQLTAATANSGLLDQILGAIKEGQVLVLDGDAVVGGTAKKMDGKLGQLRLLAARGAR